MSETINCIFCRKDKPPTDEHVVPEFAGGSLIIQDVCKSCNDRMGSDFEGPISRSIIFRLLRHIYGIQGKSSTPISAFPNTGTSKDGSKIKVDSELKPYVVPSIEEEKLESGGIAVSMRIDESDKEKIPQIIEAKIRRTAKNQWPDMAQDEVDALVKDALESLPTEYTVQSHQPTIGFSESIDLTHLRFLMMKIAYEIAFHHFGSTVLSDEKCNNLREAIYTRDEKATISGTLFPEPDPFSYIPAPEDSHCILLCSNICYVRLFNTSAIIQVSDGHSKHCLNEEQWVVYWFNYKSESWEKENLINYLAAAV